MHMQKGDVPVGQLLVLALILIPLIITFITFGKELTAYAAQQWGFPLQLVSFDSAGLLAALAAFIAVVAYSGKRMVSHLENRGRLLILEELGRTKQITRPSARELLTKDLFWYRTLLRNIHIDILAALEKEGRIKANEGGFVLADTEITRLQESGKPASLVGDESTQEKA